MIKIQCPAKINLTLEIVNRREDGFHNIKSIMQMISLYDYLTIDANKSEEISINLSGTSKEIPYDEKNLVYKAAELFLKESGKKADVSIFIEKNIPISAGLAGGSTDAAGTIYGLNLLFGEIFDNTKLNELCSKLGSDLNVCLQGGCLLATGRGEKTEPLLSQESKVTLIKPKNLGISAAEAYKKYAAKENKPQYNMTEKMINAINRHADIKEFLYNDLEYAVFDSYKELQEIKRKIPQAVMSGSGSTYFVLGDIEQCDLDNSYQIISGLRFIPDGVRNIS